MQPADYTAGIPAEILLHIFNSACLDDLRRFMLVSRRWRDLARSHPTFWTAPYLDGTAPSDVAFFLSQISAGAGKPMNVELHVVGPNELLESTILPGIATQLDCYTDLALHVHISHAPAVFQLLRGPTSSLNLLGIFFEASTDTGDSSIVSLPDDILPQSGQIDSVYLQNLDIPCAPAALRTAKNVVYCQRSRSSSTSLLAVAEAFPHALDMTLSGRGICASLNYSDWPKRWEYLKSLTISVGRHRLQRILSAVPLPNVLHITTDHTRNPALSILLMHLHGHLSMAFKEHDAEAFVLHLSSIGTGHTRSFRERRSAWANVDSPPHDALRTGAVVSRLVSLSIPVPLWEFVWRRIVSLPRLKILTIILLRTAGHVLLMSSPNEDAPMLDCPGLKVLVLDGMDGAPTVPLEDVKQIILTGLKARTPIDLVMRCSWRGFPPDLRPMVETVFDSYQRVNHYPQTPWHSR